MAKFNRTITLKKKEIEEYNHLLDLPAEEGGVAKAGYPEDTTIEVFSTLFDDGHCADIKICSGQSNFFCDPILFDNEGTEVCVLDCADELDGEYVFAVNGDKYIVRVCADNEQFRQFEAVVKVECYFKTVVSARNLCEATEIATVEFSNADCGDFCNVDGTLLRVEEI